MRSWRRRAILVALIPGVTLFGVWWSRRMPASQETIYEPVIAPVEAAAICSWRNPGADLARFFPAADHWTIESLILSSQIVELERSLGRALTPEENPLRRHRVWRQRTAIGAVFTQRLRGEHGAIEIVLAVDDTDRVQGVSLQRMREPAGIAAALTNAGWLAAFNGGTATNRWQLGVDVPEMNAEARGSATVVVRGVRDLLLLSQAAAKVPQPDVHLHPAE